MQKTISDSCPIESSLDWLTMKEQLGENGAWQYWIKYKDYPDTLATTKDLESMFMVEPEMTASNVLNLKNRLRKYNEDNNTSHSISTTKTKGLDRYKVNFTPSYFSVNLELQRKDHSSSLGLIENIKDKSESDFNYIVNQSTLKNLTGTLFKKELFDNQLIDLRTKLSKLNDKNLKEGVNEVYRVENIKQIGQSTQFTYDVFKYPGKLDIQSKIERSKNNDTANNLNLSNKTNKLNNLGDQLSLFQKESINTSVEKLIEFSKERVENGLRVIHYSNKNISNFEVQDNNKRDNGQVGRGIYFAVSPYYKRLWFDEVKRTRGNSIPHEVLVKLKNPFRVVDVESKFIAYHLNRAEDFLNQLIIIEDDKFNIISKDDFITESHISTNKYYEEENLIEMLKSSGYSNEEIEWLLPFYLKNKYKFEDEKTNSFINHLYKGEINRSLYEKLIKNTTLGYDGVINYNDDFAIAIKPSPETDWLAAEMVVFEPQKSIIRTINSLQAVQKDQFSIVNSKRHLSSKTVSPVVLNKIASKLKELGVPVSVKSSEDLKQRFNEQHSKASAFLRNNIIYLNSDKATLDSPMHEYAGHIFLNYLKTNEPDNFKKVIELSLQADITEQISRLYPELTDPTDLGQEVFSTLIGLENQDKLMPKDASLFQSILGIFKNNYIFKILNDTFKQVFGINYDIEIDYNSSLSEIMNQVSNDLFDNDTSLFNNVNKYIKDNIKNSLTDTHSQEEFEQELIDMGLIQQVCKI